MHPHFFREAIMEAWDFTEGLMKGTNLCVLIKWYVRRKEALCFTYGTSDATRFVTWMTNCAGMYSRICDSFTSTTIISFLSPLLPFLLHFCRSVENWELWKVLPLKCEVCRNIAIHASPTEFFVSNLYISSRFNFFLFLQNCSLNFCISNTPLRGKWVGKKLNELGQ